MANKVSVGAVTDVDTKGIKDLIDQIKAAGATLGDFNAKGAKNPLSEEAKKATQSFKQLENTIGLVQKRIAARRKAGDLTAGEAERSLKQLEEIRAKGQGFRDTKDVQGLKGLVSESIITPSFAKAGRERLRQDIAGLARIDPTGLSGSLTNFAGATTGITKFAGAIGTATVAVTGIAAIMNRINQRDEARFQVAGELGNNAGGQRGRSLRVALGIDRAVLASRGRLTRSSGSAIIDSLFKAGISSQNAVSALQEGQGNPANIRRLAFEAELGISHPTARTRQAFSRGPQAQLNRIETSGLRFENLTAFDLISLAADKQNISGRSKQVFIDRFFRDIGVTGKESINVRQGERSQILAQQRTAFNRLFEEKTGLPADAEFSASTEAVGQGSSSTNLISQLRETSGSLRELNATLKQSIEVTAESSRSAPGSAGGDVE